MINELKFKIKFNNYDGHLNEFTDERVFNYICKAELRLVLLYQQSKQDLVGLCIKSVSPIHNFELIE